MASKQRSLRGAKTSFQGPDEEEEYTVVVPTKPKVLKPLAKPSLLSFGGDDDTTHTKKTESKKDKPKPSKFMRAPLEVTGTDPLQIVSSRSGNGEYTADRLKELQGNAMSFSSSKYAASLSKDQAPVPVTGATIKLSGSFKPAGQMKDDRYSINSASLVHSVSGRAVGNDMPLPPPQRPSQRAQSTGLAGLMQSAEAEEAGNDADADGDDLVSGMPDAETIRRAKAKRERLRQAHLAPDYVPVISGLSSGMGHDGGSSVFGDALVGEVGASGSDDEHEQEAGMRIAFSVNALSNKKDASVYQQTLAPGDAEEEEFADEQLRKALRKQQDRALASSRPQENPGSIQTRAASLLTGGNTVMANLAQGLARLVSSQKQAEQNLGRTSEQLDGALLRIEGFEAELVEAGEKYVFVQQAKVFIADLCECLAVKSAIVEELEDTRMELLEDRAASLKTFSRAMEEEMLRPAEAAVAAALRVLSRGGALPAATAAAEAARLEAEGELLGDDLAVELDEFGRNTNLELKRELDQRATKRRKLLAVSQAQMHLVAAGDPFDAHDKDEADSVEVEEVARFESRYQEILEASGTVFADVGDEYATLGSVKQQLEAWKDRHAKEYGATYMHLSTPALFAPFVRLELLTWDPLFSSSKHSSGGSSSASFQNQGWYQQLFDFGAKVGEEESMADDPDQDLVPQLVCKLVLPMVLHLVNRCWDTFDRKQSTAVAHLVADVLVYVPPEDERMQELIQMVQSLLEAAVNSCSVPCWPPSAVMASEVAATVAFRRFRTAVHLLQSVSAFEGLLSRSKLMELAFEKLVLRQLLPYCRAAGQDLQLAVARTDAMASALHLQWFAAAASGPVQTPLREHLSALAASLSSQKSAHLGPSAAILASQLKRVGMVERSGMLLFAYQLQDRA